jgi:hypothetical protein
MVKGIIFLGTPHEGSDRAALLKFAQNLVSPFKAAKSSTTLTAELETYSAYLEAE